MHGRKNRPADGTSLYSFSSPLLPEETTPKDKLCIVCNALSTLKTMNRKVDTGKAAILMSSKPFLLRLC